MSDDEPLYYMQTGFSGNSLLWWREGRAGYTTDIKRAHVFSKSEAYSQAKVRPGVDQPWRKDYIDQHLEHHVNNERVSRTDEGAV